MTRNKGGYAQFSLKVPLWSLIACYDCSCAKRKFIILARLRNDISWSNEKWIHFVGNMRSIQTSWNKKGRGKRQEIHPPSFTLEDPEFYELDIANGEHRARFAKLARLGILNPKFSSYDIAEIGIHGNMLAPFTLLGWKHIMYVNYPTFGKKTMEFLGTITGGRHPTPESDI